MPAFSYSFSAKSNSVSRRIKSQAEKEGVVRELMATSPFVLGSKPPDMKKVLVDRTFVHKSNN